MKINSKQSLIHSVSIMSHKLVVFALIIHASLVSSIAIDLNRALAALPLSINGMHINKVWQDYFQTNNKRVNRTFNLILLNKLIDTTHLQEVVIMTKCLLPTRALTTPDPHHPLIRTGHDDEDDEGFTKNKKGVTITEVGD